VELQPIILESMEKLLESAKGAAADRGDGCGGSPMPGKADELN
jgi:hypothetical protein